MKQRAKHATRTQNINIQVDSDKTPLNRNPKEKRETNKTKKSKP